MAKPGGVASLEPVKILVSEDDAKTAQAIVRGLEAEGHETAVAGVTRSFLRRTTSTRPELGSGELDLGVVKEAPQWEYQVVVTNLNLDLVWICDLYRQRADVENTYDELKNPWGWDGFMARDLLRCQVAARTVALVDNWWSLFVACAQPDRGREAVPAGHGCCVRWGGSRSPAAR